MRLLAHAFQCEPSRQHVVPGAHRVLRRAKQQLAVLEPEETLLFGADIIGPPCRLDFEHDTARGVVDRAWPFIRDIGADERRFHLITDRRRAAYIKSWDVARHDLQVAPSPFDDDRTDRMTTPGISRDRPV